MQTETAAEQEQHTPFGNVPFPPGLFLPSEEEGWAWMEVPIPYKYCQGLGKEKQAKTD